MVNKENSFDKKKLPWFRFYATDWLTSPTVSLMTRVQKSMLVDLLCYIHGSGNCRLNATKQEAMRLLGVYGEEQKQFDAVWDQLAICPEDESSVTHLKMWEWYCSDREVHLKRQKAGRKGGKQRSSNAQAKSKQSLSKAQANSKQTLYESVSVSVSESNNKSKKHEIPSLEQVIEFFVSKGSNKDEAERYFYFYESKDWKVGKNKMSYWKSAAAGWIKRKEMKPEQNATRKLSFQESKDQRTQEILKKAFERG